MNWTELLKAEIEGTYKAAFGLMELVDDKGLSWKPATGSNWMTTGQLLRHMTEACGLCCKGFVEGKWPMPADAKPDEMLPPADKLPTVASVAEARTLLEADKQVALAMVASPGTSSPGSVSSRLVTTSFIRSPSGGSRGSSRGRAKGVPNASPGSSSSDIRRLSPHRSRRVRRWSMTGRPSVARGLSGR